MAGAAGAAAAAGSAERAGLQIRSSPGLPHVKIITSAAVAAAAGREMLTAGSRTTAAGLSAEGAEGVKGAAAATGIVCRAWDEAGVVAGEAPH